MKDIKNNLHIFIFVLCNTIIFALMTAFGYMMLKVTEYFMSIIFSYLLK